MREKTGRKLLHACMKAVEWLAFPIGRTPVSEMERSGIELHCGVEGRNKPFHTYQRFIYIIYIKEALL